MRVSGSAELRPAVEAVCLVLLVQAAGTLLYISWSDWASLREVKGRAGNPEAIVIAWG